MGLFGQNNKSCMSVMNLSLTDKDDELERIKKQTRGFSMHLSLCFLLLTNGETEYCLLAQTK